MKREDHDDKPAKFSASISATPRLSGRSGGPAALVIGSSPAPAGLFFGRRGALRCEILAKLCPE